MTVNEDRLGVALLAEGDADLVLRAISALGAALDRLERDGVATSAVVIDRTADAEAAAVVASLEDTPVLRGDDGEPDAAALLRAVDALPPECGRVVLAATDAAPVEGALCALLACARERDADLALADSSDPAPYALLHLRARDALARVAAAAPEQPPVLALARELAAAGRVVATTPGAGQERARRRYQLPPDVFPGVTVRVATPLSAAIGFGSYFGEGSKIVTFAVQDRIDIGAYCSMADDVGLVHPGGEVHDTQTGLPAGLRLRGGHRMWAASTFPVDILTPDPPGYDTVPTDGSVASHPLQIGNDVWIGTRALVLGPVTIGDGAVIGAGAVIRRDVAPYEVVIGNPARPIRRRFDDRTCERLLAMRWWDWLQPVVRGNHLRFTEPIARFLDRFDPAGSLAAGPEPDRAPGPAPETQAGAAVSAVS